MTISDNLKDLHYTEYAVKKVKSQQLRLVAVGKTLPFQVTFNTLSI